MAIVCPLMIVCGAVAFAVAPQQPASDWQPRVRALILQLGDSSYAKREAAAKALLAEGERIVPLLDEARKNADLELGRRLDRIRYHLVGVQQELTQFLNGPAFGDRKQKMPIELLRAFEPDPLPELVALVAANQPKAGDFLLKIIANPNHGLHRPATQLFCESWESASAQQLRTYLETAFNFQTVHRARYPQGIDARIETRFWHPYGPIGWPKGLAWQIDITHTLDGKHHGKPFVFAYPGGGAATGWINAGKLDQGEYKIGCKVDLAFVHHGAKHEFNARTAEIAFAVGPAVLANDLIAPADAALVKQVRQSLRMLDYHGQDGDQAVAGPWETQMTWVEPIGARRGLHVPVWYVKGPLPVDLCFDATICDLETGRRYPAGLLVLHKGKTGRGEFLPRDGRVFAADRDGFVQVQIELKPSASQAISDPAVSKYFPWPITSPTLRAKIVGEMKAIDLR